MTDYSELVKALRSASTVSTAWEKLMHDAADAIEALQKRIVSALTALHLANEKMGYYGIQPYTEADGEDMISDWVKTLVHEELKQQLPKRGKWLPYEFNTNGTWHKCSVCGVAYQYKDAPNSGWWINHNYCPNCGAKMEVQDADT